MNAIFQPIFKLGILILYTQFSTAQTLPTDFFRSVNVTPSNWNSTSSWESSHDGETDWILATSIPGSEASEVIIAPNHTILLNSPGIEITNTYVFGNLEINSGITFSVEGEDHLELFVEDGGNFIVNDPDTYPVGNAWGLVKTGGTITADPNADSTYFLYDFVSTYFGLFYFEDASICDWRNEDYPASYNFFYDIDELFFPYPYDSQAMPIFRISNLPTNGGYGNSTSSNTIYAILELNTATSFSFQGSRQKFIVGGIKSSENFEGTVTQTSNSGNLNIGTDNTHYFLPNVVPDLSGSLNLILKSAGLRLVNGGNIPENSSIQISSLDDVENSSINRVAGNLDIYGTLDISNMRITNNGSGGVFVKDGGLIRTRNTGGLFGNGSAIVNAANLHLEDGNTVEYYASTYQEISSGKTYYHLVFSGESVKDAQNQTDIHNNGSVLITGNSIVDFSDFNLGLTTLNDIRFQMDSGQFIVGTGGTQPRFGGTYLITGGEIEFTGNSVTQIRVIPDYHDIRISGLNKSPGAKGFQIMNHLIIEPSGELTIPQSNEDEPPYVLHAWNGIQVQSEGILVLENNANLLQNPDATNSGILTLKRNANVPSNQYNFWSSPTKEQDLYNLYPDIPSEKVMIYNTATDFFTVLPNNATSEFGIGYSIKGPFSNAPLNPDGTFSVTANFTGTPHNESVSSNLENEIVLSNVGNGYNLIGNPYPSNLDLQLVYELNSNFEQFTQDEDDSPNFYFWDNVGNTAYSQMGPEYEDYTTNNYATYNPNFQDGTAADNPNGSGKIPNGIVRPGQGFIIRVAENATKLIMNNQMRTSAIKRDINDDEAPYFKEEETGFSEFTNARLSNNKFWIELVNPDQIHLQIAVGYFKNAENTFDKFDSPVLNENSSDLLFSFSVDNKKLSIQGRKGGFSIEDKIPIGIKTFKSGKYKLQLNQVKGIFKDMQIIYVFDKELNTIHNLSESAYEIELEKGQYFDRFELVFKDDLNSEPILINAGAYF